MQCTLFALLTGSLSCVDIKTILPLSSIWYELWFMYHLKKMLTQWISVPCGKNNLHLEENHIWQTVTSRIHLLSRFTSLPDSLCTQAQVRKIFQLRAVFKHFIIHSISQKNICFAGTALSIREAVAVCWRWRAVKLNGNIISYVKLNIPYWILCNIITFRLLWMLEFVDLGNRFQLFSWLNWLLGK